MNNIAHPSEYDPQQKYTDPVLTRTARWLRHYLVLLLALFATPVFSADVLLVDDDDNAPDIHLNYTAALDDLGVSYDIRDTNNTDNEPDEASLSGYDTVAIGPGAATEPVFTSIFPMPGLDNRPLARIRLVHKYLGRM